MAFRRSVRSRFQQFQQEDEEFERNSLQNPKSSEQQTKVTKQVQCSSPAKPKPTTYQQFQRISSDSVQERKSAPSHAPSELRESHEQYTYAEVQRSPLKTTSYQHQSSPEKNNAEAVALSDRDLEAWTLEFLKKIGMMGNEDELAEEVGFEVGEEIVISN